MGAIHERRQNSREIRNGGTMKNERIEKLRDRNRELFEKRIISEKTFITRAVTLIKKLEE